MPATRRLAHMSWLLAGALSGLVAGLAVGCDDAESPAGTTAPELPGFKIADGVHGGGNPDFFFLPPLVPDPSSHPSYDPGAFDPHQSPEVEICELGGNGCTDTPAEGFPLRFSMSDGRGSERVRVSEEEEHYIVNWRTKRYQLDPATTYRIEVLVAGAVLGFADVQIASGGRGLKNVNTAEVITLKDDHTLPIKFRLERGAVTVIGQDGGTVTGAGGRVVLRIPPGALDRPAGITVVPTTDVPDSPHLVPGTTFDLGPDGLLFSTPVLLTVHYDDEQVPEGSDERGFRLHTVRGGAWSILLRGTAQPAENTVSAPIESFSSYGILESVVIEISESIGVGDVPGGTPPAGVELTETVGVADSPRVVPPAVLGLAESVGVHDSPRVVPPTVIQVAELITVSDAPRVLPPIEIHVNEVIGVGDAVATEPGSG